MEGKYTQRINSILKTRKLTWTWLSEATSIKSGTLSYCKTNDNYSIQYLEKIAEALEMTPAELIDVQGRFDSVRDLIKRVDLLRKMLNEDFGDIRDI